MVGGGKATKVKAFGHEGRELESLHRRSTPPLGHDPLPEN